MSFSFGLFQMWNGRGRKRAERKNKKSERDCTDDEYSTREEAMRMATLDGLVILSRLNCFRLVTWFLPPYRPTTLSWFITRIVPQLLFMIHIALTTTTQQKPTKQTQKRDGLCPLTSPKAVKWGWRHCFPPCQSPPSLLLWSFTWLWRQ